MAQRDDKFSATKYSNCFNNSRIDAKKREFYDQIHVYVFRKDTSTNALSKHNFPLASSYKLTPAFAALTPSGAAGTPVSNFNLNLKWDLSTSGISIDSAGGVTESLFKIYLVGYFDNPTNSPTSVPVGENWCLPWYQRDEDAILSQVDDIPSTVVISSNYLKSVIYSFEYFLSTVCIVDSIVFPSPIPD